MNYIKIFGDDAFPKIHPNPSVIRHTRHRGVVYFLVRDGLVKIGYSVNVGRRIDEICQSSIKPARIVGTISSAPSYKSRLHERFATDHRGRGWFVMSEQIVRFMDKRLGARMFIVTA